MGASRTGPWRSLRWVCRELGRGDHSGKCVENWAVEITQVSVSRTGSWRSLRWVCRELGRGRRELGRGDHSGVCRELGRRDHSGKCVEKWAVEITQVDVSRTGPWRPFR